MAVSVVFDDKDFQRKMTELVKVRMPSAGRQATHDVATEALRLSAFEVPHDKGLLQNSGNVEDKRDHSIVGYNKVYAARLHEHPEYRFQKNRKGKYLEDPIKKNSRIFLNYFGRAIKGKL